MNKYLQIIGLLIALVLPATVRADDLANHVDLSPLRPIAVQQDQTMKTLDTFARQVITTVTGHGTLDGHEPVYTLLDMSFRPELYVDRNIIKISNVPAREGFQGLDWVDPQEAQRIPQEREIKSEIP